MPDTINKQTLINLLIDSPLREPIKINLIDIVNNTSEPDLPKVYATIVKELEIFQKATERRMKLAEETIAKLGGSNQSGDQSIASDTQALSNPSLPTPPSPTPVPPLDLPPLPTPPVTTLPSPEPTPVMPTAPLSVPPLDLPPLPTTPTPPVSSDLQPPSSSADVSADVVETTPTLPTNPNTASLPTPEPLGGAAPTTSSDEAALAEIQKELESLKAGVAADANPTPAPAAPQV